MKFITHSEEETIQAGRAIARALPARAVVSLAGDLGAGKTTLVKGIAQERAGVQPEEVSSPTFTLIHEYGEPARVFHIDLYRLEHERELLTLGLEEFEEREALMLIEWANRFPRLPVMITHEIAIAHQGEGRREIVLREALS